MKSFIPQALIRKKRDGEELSSAELCAFIQGVTDGSMADYQVSAMLMAIFFRGLSDAELAVFADAMLHSGEVLDLSSIDRAKVDKHSTGGVGDKISLPLAASVAACGVAVPMISGRGLGHTGGTLDKLESIPGFSVNLSADQFARQVEEIGVCLIGQTSQIAPADKRLYSLRDVTATVESIPLIASSIMSKKLAEGIDALVLDCKVGDGAFMGTESEARELASAIQAIGAAAGKPVTVVLTHMDEPIGCAVGNAIEVAESIEILRGRGPGDTRELTCVLGAEMLLLANRETEPDKAQAAIEATLDDGSALNVFRQLVSAQGGDLDTIDDPRKLPQAANRHPIVANQSGTISRVGARAIGMAALSLGAGRTRVQDIIDPGAGIEISARVGQPVSAGETVATLLYNDDRGLAAAIEMTTNAIDIAEDSPLAAKSRIISVIRDD